MLSFLAQVIDPRIDAGQVIQIASLLISAGIVYGGISARLKSGEKRFDSIEKKVDDLVTKVGEILVDQARDESLEDRISNIEKEHLERTRPRLHDLEGFARAYQTAEKDMRGDIERLERTLANMQSRPWSDPK